MNNAKRVAQIEMLHSCAVFSKTGLWVCHTSYPNCAWDLVEAGLISPSKKITIAGQAALFLLEKGADPLPGLQNVVDLMAIPSP